jgi:hypothetical protein
MTREIQETVAFKSEVELVVGDRGREVSGDNAGGGSDKAEEVSVVSRCRQVCCTVGFKGRR